MTFAPGSGKAYGSLAIKERSKIYVFPLANRLTSRMARSLVSRAVIFSVISLRAEGISESVVAMGNRNLKSFAGKGISDVGNLALTGGLDSDGVKRVV